MVTSIKGNDTSTFGGNIDVTGNVITDAPAFSAYMGSNQAISAATVTKVIFNTEEFDTNSNYDNSTNYRFTPTVSGYYQINAHISWLGFAAATQGAMYVYKNGSSIRRVYTVGSGYGYFNSMGNIIYANGTTDYFEIYCRNSAAETLDGSSGSSYFSAVLVRAA